MLNVSILKGGNSFSVDMVLRNQEGHYTRAKTMRFAGHVSLLEAEMMGIQKELPTASIIVESDALLNVNAMNKAGFNYWSWEILLSTAEPFFDIMVGFQLIMLESG